MGDFFVGMLIVEDLSTPFLSAAKILRLVSTCSSLCMGYVVLPLSFSPIPSLYICVYHLFSSYTPYTQLGLKNTLLYRINGLILLISFLLVRVLYTPLAILIYAGQYHNWNIWSALNSMYPVCHFSNSVQFVLQTYWYLAIVSIALGTVRRPRNKSAIFLAHSNDETTGDVKCD